MPSGVRAVAERPPPPAEVELPAAQPGDDLGLVELLANGSGFVRLTPPDRTDEDVLPLTHADLAEFLGVQRSTVSTVLRTFQTQGLITQQRGGIIIADRAGLEEIACECYDVIRAEQAELSVRTPTPV